MNAEMKRALATIHEWKMGNPKLDYDTTRLVVGVDVLPRLFEDGLTRQNCVIYNSAPTGCINAKFCGLWIVESLEHPDEIRVESFDG